MPQKNILILTGDADLGHRSAAEATRDAIQNRFGKSCKIKIVNPIIHFTIPSFFRESQSDYDIIVKKIPELYKFAYEISDSNLPVKLIVSGLTLIFFQVLREILGKFKPNIVITTYPIFIAPLAALTLLNEITIPWITVVTDLVTVHHIWFNKYTTV